MVLRAVDTMGEGVEDEHTYLVDMSRDETAFWEGAEKTECFMPNKVVAAATARRRLKVVGDGVLERKEIKSKRRKALPLDWEAGEVKKQKTHRHGGGCSADQYDARRDRCDLVQVGQ